MKSSVFETLARVGYATKGCIYAVIGLLAVLAVIGAGGELGGSRNAIETIGQQPFGRVLLGALAVGLFAYAGWRLLQAGADPENHGTDREGLLKRLGHGVSGVAHAILGVTAAQMVLQSGGGGGGGAKTWVAELMAVDTVGPIVVGVIGAVVIGVGIQQLHKGLTTSFQKKLKTAGMSRRARELAEKVGKAGLTARAVVFFVIGGAVIRAAFEHDPGEVETLGEALATIGSQPLGSVLLATVALGLMAYAAHQLVFAKYRRIPS